MALKNERLDEAEGVGSGSTVEYGYTGLAGFRLRLGPILTMRLEGVVDYIANPANCDLAMLQMLPSYLDGSSILQNLFRSPTKSSS